VTSTDPFIIVSADTHIGPRLVDDLRPYCPEAHLRPFDEFAEMLRKQQEASGGQLGFAGAVRSADWKVSRRNLQTEGHYDIHARLRDLDNDGIAAEVVFHDSQNGNRIPFNTSTIFSRADEKIDFQMLGVGQHVYNQWLADQLTVQPERHVGLVYLPWWDVDAAVKELEWAAGAGLKGVNFPYPKTWMKSFNYPEWEPLWSACEDLDMVLCNHGGGAPTATGGPGAMSIVKLEVSNMTRISPLSHLIFGGVFERHPNLRLVLTESVGPWWPAVMYEFDSIYIHDGWEYPDFWPRVPRKPSEYAAENVFIGASFLARFEVEDAMAKGYVRNLIWGSDYPHFEGTFQYGITTPEGEPATKTALRFTFAGLPEQETGWLLGGNAMRAYGLDEAALTKVAARIKAPTFDQLSVPVDPLPPETDRGHHSYRTFGFWA
jgi:predicted TIM-barrel fold metal-dependent hydrolase